MIIEKRAKSYSENDLQILGTLANHSALAIQGLRSQESLREAKELESFHKLSSFVVHDFRNILSIISMLAENAKVHMNDREFQQDLTRALGDSAQKIRQTLSRISLSANTFEISLQELDLDGLVAEVLAGITAPPGIQLVSTLKADCKLPTDGKQLQKVVENLVLNACDAIPETGEIQVTTFVRSGERHRDSGTRLPAQRWAGVSVSDTGCGMTNEFIQTKLFRPFQTTKRNGLGIGLYHCKEIVAALGGSISVASGIGKGTTFWVSLPMTADSPVADAESNGINKLKVSTGSSLS